MPDNTKASDKDQARLNEKKWSKPLWSAGWVALPSVILENQGALGLKPPEINVIMQIAKHWWRRDELPFPSKRSIAESMGVTPRTVQRIIQRLEELKFLRRIPRTTNSGGNKSNYYDLNGLIKAVTPYAKKALSERESAKKAAQQRRTRKIPKASSSE